LETTPGSYPRPFRMLLVKMGRPAYSTGRRSWDSVLVLGDANRGAAFGRALR